MTFEGEGGSNVSPLSKSIKMADSMHTAKNKFYMWNKKYPSNFWIFASNLLDKSVEEWNFYGVLFCKFKLNKMASIKTNKNKNLTPLLKTNFSWLETLSLGPKRFHHSEGPKNAICLWLRLGKWNGSKHCRLDIVWYFLVSATDKLHF